MYGGGGARKRRLRVLIVLRLHWKLHVGVVFLLAVVVAAAQGPVVYLDGEYVAVEVGEGQDVALLEAVCGGELLPALREVHPAVAVVADLHAPMAAPIGFP